MSQTIAVSDATYATLYEVAQARGVSIEALLDTLAGEALHQPTGKLMTGDEFIQMLENAATPQSSSDIPGTRA